MSDQVITVRCGIFLAAAGDAPMSACPPLSRTMKQAPVSTAVYGGGKRRAGER